MTEIYLLFLQSALQIFMNLNLFLQKQDPLIGSVSSSLKRFLQLLACKFIPIPLDVLKHKDGKSKSGHILNQ